MKAADPPRGRQVRRRRGVACPAIRGSGGYLESLRNELQAALLQENAAVGHLRDLGRSVAEIIARAVSAGIPYDTVARLALRVRLGRAPTIGERLREADRLRKRRSRHLVTAGHVGQPAPGIGFASAGVASVEEATIMADKKMIKRTTTTTVEELVDGDALHGANPDEDLDDADGDDEAEPAPAPPRRRR